MVSKSSLLDWMGPVLEFLVHCLFWGVGFLFIHILVGLESSLSSKLLLDTMSLTHGDISGLRGAQMSRAQRTEGWAKRPRARMLVFLFLPVNSPCLSLSLCISLVAPSPTSAFRPVVWRLSLALPPIFDSISAVHTLARLGIWDPFHFPVLVLSHFKSRSGTVMSGVKDSA